MPYFGPEVGLLPASAPIQMHVVSRFLFLNVWSFRARVSWDLLPFRSFLLFRASGYSCWLRCFCFCSLPSSHLVYLAVLHFSLDFSLPSSFLGHFLMNSPGIGGAFRSVTPMKCRRAGEGKNTVAFVLGQSLLTVEQLFSFWLILVQIIYWDFKLCTVPLLPSAKSFKAILNGHKIY